MSWPLCANTFAFYCCIYIESLAVMAESENAQHIQFGDDINPAKAPNSSYGYKQELAISEKLAGVDAEERAIQIANADLNHKHKQVALNEITKKQQI